ncbi:MAG: MBL fold metallo-hydrolase [Myxococcales bacterium]|nr:MBL fold metallo-hydrolase [Myxococcales bacterium]
MRIHHLSCGTMCPHMVGQMPCHCLLLETPSDGLVLVETGLGTEDIARAKERFSRSWRLLARPALDLEETAIRQVERLGFDARDVRHVVVTHLDLDHAGGLPDFPDATVHVHAKERDAAMRREGRRARGRYVPAHFAHGPKWKTYDGGGERWFGFEAVRAIGDEVLLVPLPGHTPGHSAVAVRDGGRWLLHCGDGFFHRSTLAGGRPPLLLRWFERRVETDAATRIRNAARLADLARDHGDEVRIFNAHDPVLFEQARAARPSVHTAM